MLTNAEVKNVIWRKIAHIRDKILETMIINTAEGLKKCINEQKCSFVNVKNVLYFSLPTSYIGYMVTV